ncbi:MAG: acyl-CoA dehydrogenase family protein, partial [Alterinioella nitratireducens]
MVNPLFLDDEHEMLRDQIRRFVAEKVHPAADQWEKDGCVPREILREMGELGFLGIRYPEEYGGSAMDTRAT